MAEMDTSNKLEEMRKGSVAAVDITDAHGRNRKINVSELNEADLALAEQFGYHPVLMPFSYPSKQQFPIATSFTYTMRCTGLQAGVWIPFKL